jgi:hypothetical protein
MEEVEKVLKCKRDERKVRETKNYEVQWSTVKNDGCYFSFLLTHITFSIMLLSTNNLDI